jgi:uracil-DNA glycosylase
MTIRAHADPKILTTKLSRRDEAHIAPLTALVRRIQALHAGVPFFDPSNGGTDASILCLLEAPGPKAGDFVSQENNDQTAENMHRLMDQAGLARCDVVLWNVVPFYIGASDRSKLRAARQGDLDAGRPWLVELFGLLPHLKVVLLLGRKAQGARDLVKALRPDVILLEGWHPSPLAMNREPDRWQQLLDVLRSANIARSSRA